MTIEALDPTFDEIAAGVEPAPRLDDLSGAVVGIVSNGKHGTVPFFDALARELRTHHGVAEVVRVTKPNYSAPAGAEVLEPASTWHALISGIGD